MKDKPNTPLSDPQRWIADWQGKIAAAAVKGEGLDIFRRALHATKEDGLPLEVGRMAQARVELWEAGLRHEVAAPNVLGAIYAEILSEPPPDTEEELDQVALMEGERRGDDAEIERLSKLSPLEYEREREAATITLGCRASILDAIVKSARNAKADTKGQGRPLCLSEIDPWPESVNGQDLLDEISATIGRFVVLRNAEADAVTLWCMATHIFQSFDIFPRLTVRSATPRCGKTTLRKVVDSLVRKPLSADNIMAAALFRAIELQHPTLLLDEGDTFLNNNDELRGIINSGHERVGNVLRCVGEDHEPREFSTWAPMLLALIGDPPSTIHDRSIVITLARKKSNEHVEPFRSVARQSLNVLTRKAARWIRDNRDAIAKADPPPLDYLNDRANDNWHSLFAVGNVAGGLWAQRARNAAKALAENAGHDAASTGEMLLADIRWIFDGRPENGVDPAGQDQRLERIASTDLAEQLAPARAPTRSTGGPNWPRRWRQLAALSAACWSPSSTGFHAT